MSNTDTNPTTDQAHQPGDLAGWFRVQGTSYEWLVTFTFQDEFMEGGKAARVAGSRHQLNGLTFSVSRRNRSTIDDALGIVRELLTRDLHGLFVMGQHIEDRDDRIRYCRGTLRVAG